MKTEEVEKAVEEYAESLKSIAFENLSGEETPYLLRGAFKEGLELANNHWQEKTRWIPIEERLPNMELMPIGINISKDVLVKQKDGKYNAARLYKLQGGTPYWIANDNFEIFGITHWKEIEL